MLLEFVDPPPAVTCLDANCACVCLCLTELRESEIFLFFSVHIDLQPADSCALPGGVCDAMGSLVVCSYHVWWF
jgi:hypothetical protein